MPEERLVALLGEQRGPPAGGQVTEAEVDPVDAQLLTLKAVRALQAADIILFDGTVPAEVLDLARREAVRLPVDGRDDTEDLSLRRARSGRRVVQLKTGRTVHGGCDDLSERSI